MYQGLDEGTTIVMQRRRDRIATGRDAKLVQQHFRQRDVEVRRPLHGAALTLMRTRRI